MLLVKTLMKMILDSEQVLISQFENLETSRNLITFQAFCNLQQVRKWTNF